METVRAPSARPDTARVVRNRKVRQRRSLRVWLPAPADLGVRVGRALLAGARRGGPALLGLAIFGVVGLGAWRGAVWMRSSPRFALDDVAVHGNARLTREAILRRSGVALGQNVFTLSLE